MSELYPEEIKEYNRLTKGMEFTFMALTMDFLTHCENVIFGMNSRNYLTSAFTFILIKT